MSSLVCTHCGCSDIDKDSARGDAVCTGCGSVLEDQIIVSEVQFAENALGGTSVIGQYVSSDGPKSMSLGGGFHHGMGRESRQITLEKGRQRIQRLGAQLKLNHHCIDTAFNFFKMAVNRRITRGRKYNHVIAACCYIVCRTEGTPHMLIDLSDVLQIDVYTLGRTYLQLSKELCISIPAFDPCLYIQRFAHKLEFGEKTHEVGMTALRLLQRMKRDWLAQGRRPSGLCGAALLVAGRIHDFNRKVKDVMRVVKIGEGTIRKRLAELDATPSSQLTIDEFQKIDLEEEMDPPCFTEGKKKAKLQQLEEQGQLPKLTEEVAELQKEIDKRIEQDNQRRFRMYKKYTNDGGTPGAENSEGVPSDLVTPIITPVGSPRADNNLDDFLLQETLKNVVSETELNISELNNITGSDTTFIVDSSVNSESKANDSVTCKEEESGLRPRPSVASLGITSSIEDYMKVTVKESDDGDELEAVPVEEYPEGCELDLTGIDDEELDALILSEQEVQIKTKLWLEANEEYLKEQKAKREREAKEKEEEAKNPDLKKRKRPPRKKPLNAKHIEHSTAGDAIKKMLQEKKISSKINYDVLKDLNKTEEPCSILGPGPIEATPIQALTASPGTFKRSFPSDEVKPDMKKIKSEPLVKQEPIVKTERAPTPVIVESGPVQYNIEETEEHDEEEEEEEEEHISAAQFLGHGAAEEDYYDYDDD